MPSHVVRVHSILWLSHIPLDVYTAAFLSSHLCCFYILRIFNAPGGKGHIGILISLPVYIMTLFVLQAGFFCSPRNCLEESQGLTRGTGLGYAQASRPVSPLVRVTPCLPMVGLSLPLEVYFKKVICCYRKLENC